MRYFGLHRTIHGEVMPRVDKLPLLLATGAVLTTPEIKPQLICVIHGFFYEICVYIPNEDTLNYILGTDFREKTWLVYEGARELSGY